MAQLTARSYVKITLIVALALLITGVGSFGSCVVQDWKALSWSHLSQVGDAQLDASRVNNIDIDWATGSVDISVHSGNDIILTEYAAQGLSRAQQMRWGIAGDTLKIDYGSGWGWGCSSAGTKKLEVSVPQELAQRLKNLDIDAASGDYTVQGITCNTFRVDLASGNLDASGIKVGALDFNCASGMMTIEGEISESASMGAASGEAVLTCTGNPPRSINADIVSGSVTVFLPENLGFSAQIDKVSGSFISEFETRNNNGLYTYKDGSIKIQARMVSGDLILKKSSS